MGLRNGLQQGYFVLVNLLEGDFSLLQFRNGIGEDLVGFFLLLRDFHLIDIKLFLLFFSLSLVLVCYFGLLFDVLNEFFNRCLFLVDFHLLDF